MLNLFSYRCNPGYTLVGDSTIKCRSGIWSANFPVCTCKLLRVSHPYTYFNKVLKLNSDVQSAIDILFSRVFDKSTHSKSTNTALNIMQRTIEYFSLLHFAIENLNVFICNKSLYSDLLVKISRSYI